MPMSATTTCKAARQGTAIPPDSVNTPARHINPCGGFTLIEILIAITIIAVLSGVAVLSLNIGGHDGVLHDEAKRLFQLNRIAADDAVFKSAQLGVRFTQKDYTFYRLEEVTDGDDKKTDADSDKRKARKRQWRAVSDNPRLRQRKWPDGIEVEVRVDDIVILLDEEVEKKDEKKEEKEKKDLRPHIIFLSNGETLPNTEVQLRSINSSKAWRVGQSEDGLMALTAIEE